MRLNRSFAAALLLLACGGDAAAPKPQAPTAPTDVLTSARTAEITITWKDVANETGYRVEYRREGEGAWVPLAEPAANVTSAVHTNVSHAVQYYYRVAACNAAGCSAWAEASGKWQATGGPPALLEISLSNISVYQATVVARARSGGLPVDFTYSLHKANNLIVPIWESRSNWAEPATPGDFEAVVTSHVEIRNLEPGTDYVVYVEARNGSGASPTLGPKAFRTLVPGLAIISDRWQGLNSSGWYAFAARINPNGSNTEYRFEMVRAGESFDTLLSSETAVAHATSSNWPANARFMGAVAQSGVTYKWRIVATNSAGTVVSDTMQFKQP